MTDLERVQRMRDYNWKPATQYWREMYERSQAKVEELKQRIQELEK